MKYPVITALLLGATLSATANDNAPAFPGAEGHGRYVTGGRGGEVRHVTNLNDSGTGSLREAVKGNNKKIVVFDVGGLIELKSNLQIGANTTIAGQTAPGPGITVRYFTVEPKNNNIIIRFLRFRRGQEKDVNDGADAIWTRNRTGIILDHCSMSWSIDEVASFYDNNNFTMQWCTIAESLNNAGHGKGAHGYGGIWGGKLASFHHNLIAHVNNRGPRFNGARYLWGGYTSNQLASEYNWANPVQAENVDFRNCVQYNGNGSCYGGPGGGQINMVNNYYKEGPSGKSSFSRITTVSVASSGNSNNNTAVYGMTSRYFIQGNTTESLSGGKTVNRDWAGVSYDGGVLNLNGERYSKDDSNYYGDNVEHISANGSQYVRIRLDEEAPKGDVTTHDAETAFDKVLAYAGASLSRDAEDTRYAEEARTGTCQYKGSVTKKYGLIDLVSDVNGVTYVEPVYRPADFDTDGDGMPDTWERAMGLNPDDASDGKAYTLDTERGWYTNVEVYINSLVADIMKAGNSDASEPFNDYYPAAGSGIGSVTMSGEVQRIEYYNLNGVRIENPAPGISIRRMVFTDGRVVTDKVIK